MIAPLQSFTTRTLVVYALGFAVIAGLYSAFLARPSLTDGLAPQPFSPVLPNLTEVDTTDAAQRILASGIGQVVDPNAPAVTDTGSGSGPDGEIDPENPIPRVFAVAVEQGEPFAYVRADEGFLKLTVGDSVGMYRLVELNASKAQFEKSDGDISTQLFFSATD